MKKFCSVLLMLCLVVSLYSCGNDHVADNADHRNLCIECGSEISATYNFCAFCGVSLKKQNSTGETGVSDSTDDQAHIHSYSDATCTDAKICSGCGATEGSALGHSYCDATCTEDEICFRCGETGGSALGHSYIDATCTEAETCFRCGITMGSALGHSYSDATCTEDETCIRCGAKKGTALGHNFSGATCTEARTCIRCGDTSGTPLGHFWIPATLLTPKTCEICEKTEGGVLSAAGVYNGDPVYAIVNGKEIEVRYTIYLNEDGSYRFSSSRSSEDLVGTWKKQGVTVYVDYVAHPGTGYELQGTEILRLLDDGFMIGTLYYEKIA